MASSEAGARTLRERKKQRVREEIYTAALEEAARLVSVRGGKR